MSEQIRLVVFFDAKAGEEAALEAATRACIPPTRQEAGCLEYTLHRDRSDASRLVLIETWKSQAALDAHMETPHLKQMFAVLERVTRSGAIIHRLEELA